MHRPLHLRGLWHIAITHMLHAHFTIKRLALRHSRWVVVHIVCMFLVCVQLGLAGKLLPADVTVKWLFACVDPCVNLQLVLAGKLFLAHVTLEWLLTCVDSTVDLQVATLNKLFRAEVTLERLFSSVGPSVDLQTVATGKLL